MGTFHLLDPEPPQPGVLIGKVAADVVFYGLAITSYEVLVRRFLRRFRRHPEVVETSDPSGTPVIGDAPEIRDAPEIAEALMVDTAAVLAGPSLLAGAGAGAAGIADSEADVPPPGPELVLDLAVVTEHHRRFRAASRCTSP